ncbi:MAG: 4Fe-4S binding protein [Promethearchaeota archaeon]
MIEKMPFTYKRSKGLISNKDIFKTKVGKLPKDFPKYPSRGWTIPKIVKIAIIFLRIGISQRKIRRMYQQEMKQPPTEIPSAPAEFWNEVREKARSLGIGILGFTEIEENFLFSDDRITHIKNFYSNCIMLGMEMEYSAMDVAPNPPASVETLRVYAALGEATIALTQFVQEKGFRAFGTHPMEGPMLLPAMAVKAKLGKIGTQGILISKEFGPRQRLSAISINISPVPESPNVLPRIVDFCEKCRLCITECPVDAIYEMPILQSDGRLTRIDADKCFPYFRKTHGCSICISVCPFHKKGPILMENIKDGL